MSVENIQCPVCQSGSKPAKAASLLNIVKDDLKHLILDESYFFCCNSNCEVIFYSEDYEKTFLLEDIKLTAEMPETSGCGCNSKKDGCNKGCCSK